MSIDPHAGQTRSVLRREYLLHTPDSFVRTPLASVTQGVTIVHASPRLGAGFLAYTAELQAGGVIDEVAEQRFIWVLAGEVSVALRPRPRTGFVAGGAGAGGEDRLSAGEFAYLPSGSANRVTARSAARVLLIEKTYDALSALMTPPARLGSESDIEAVALNGDALLLVRSLLPSDMAYDFAVNTMDYAAGAALGQVEVHVMEHGLWMLEGAGTYRLGEDLHRVEAGDFIWMAPYCPQWFIADAGVRAKYLIYKDWNRRPRL